MALLCPSAKSSAAPIEVPVATYRSTDCELGGTTVPFDPITLQQRYPTFADYERQLRLECERLVTHRYLLAEDIHRIVTLHTQRLHVLMESIEKDSVRTLDTEPKWLSQRGAGEGPAWHPELGLLTSGGGHIQRGRGR